MRSKAGDLVRCFPRFVDGPTVNIPHCDAYNTKLLKEQLY
jgi:hypothetical protein